MTPTPGPGYQKNPQHLVELHHINLQVTVHLQGIELANSAEVYLINEMKCPPRYYLPRSAVLLEHLERRQETSYCSFKGHATYYGIPGGSQPLAWSYENPYAEVAAIEGCLCFYPERVGLFQVRPLGA